MPRVKQIYFTGCAGNLTPANITTVETTNRPVLADRLYLAMVEAWDTTHRVPLTSVNFRVENLRLEPRDDPGFSVPIREKNPR